MNWIKTCFLIGAFIGFTLWTFACANKTTEEKIKTTGKVQQVTIDAEKNANMGSMLIVDIVSAYDRQLVQDLESTINSEWFASKNKFIDQFNGKIFVMSREIAPGKQIQLEYTTEIEEKPIATFIFANYESPGDHRAKVEKFKPIAITLEENEFVVSDDQFPKSK